MSHGIELIVGLGNPGQQYRDTRHNAGAMFLDEICKEFKIELRLESKFFGASARINIKGQDIRLLFPTTYMNNSGQAVAAISQYFKIPAQNILVAYDELDLPVGSVKLKKGGGHGGHNGVRDIIKALGSPDFFRLRLGIGHPGESSKVLNYVLGVMSSSDDTALQIEMKKVIDVLPLLAEGKEQIAMNKLHTKPENKKVKKSKEKNNTKEDQPKELKENNDGN